MKGGGTLNKWTVVRIGNRQYAISYKYVIGITELNNSNFIKNHPNKYCVGNYNVLGSVMPVVDGYKLTGEERLDQKNIEFMKNLGFLRIGIEDIAGKMEDTIFEKKCSKLKELLSEYDSLVDEYSLGQNDIDSMYVNKLINKLKSNIRSVRLRTEVFIDDIIENNTDPITACDEFNEIENEYKTNIYELINKIVLEYNNTVHQLCIALETKGNKFGLTVSSISSLTENESHIIRRKRTALSAGMIEIDNSMQNIIDLTKICNIAYSD